MIREVLVPSSSRYSVADAPVFRSWGSSEPGASLLTVARRRLSVSVLAITLVLGACSAGGAPGTPVPASPSVAASESPAAADSPSPPAVSSSPSPPASPPGSAGASGSGAVGVDPPIDSTQEAIAAVAAVEPRYAGYKQRNPDLIGQANYVTAKEVTGGFELVFSTGSGDCPAGCINRSFAKFTVERDGTVEKQCEWARGEVASGAPC